MLNRIHLLTTHTRGLPRSRPLIREWSSAGTAAANPGAGSGRSWVSAGRLEADLVAEGFEFCDQASGFPFGVEAAGEVVGAELVVRRTADQDVPNDDEHG